MLLPSALTPFDTFRVAASTFLYFEEAQLGVVYTYGENREVVGVSDGNGEKSVCITCHAQADKGYAPTQEMAEDLAKLKGPLGAKPRGFWAVPNVRYGGCLALGSNSLALTSRWSILVPTLTLSTEKKFKKP
jgi:hypothetical protein